MRQSPMSKMLVFAVLSGIALAAPAPDTGPGNQCREVAFKVSGTAQNLNIDPSKLPFNNVTALSAIFAANNFTKVTVSGPQTIAGWYCPPAVVNSNNNRLQFFQTSITNNRDDFNAQGGTTIGIPGQPPFPPYQPEKYSWLRYASNLGYATLALDHLGDGRTSKPDPVLLAQLNYEIVLLHDLVTQIKSGKTGQLPRKYTDLIFVGNSFGSVIGNNMAAAYPNDFTNFVLTGFSKSVLPSLPGVSLQMTVPASQQDPARFGNLSSGYLTASNQTARTNSFFGSKQQAAFDPEVARLFYTREDVVSIGQFVSTYVEIVQAPAYKGRVLVLTGEHDQAFCGPGSPDIGPARCGPLLKDTGSLFPNSQYNYYSVPQSGHALILHLTYATTLRVAHQFLAGARFAKGPDPGQ